MIHPRIPIVIEKSPTYASCRPKGRHIVQAVLCLVALAAVHAAAQPFMPGQGLLPLGDAFFMQPELSCRACYLPVSVA